MSATFESVLLPVVSPPSSKSGRTNSKSPSSLSGFSCRTNTSVLPFSPFVRHRCSLRSPDRRVVLHLGSQGERRSGRTRIQSSARSVLLSRSDARRRRQRQEAAVLARRHSRRADTRPRESRTREVPPALARHLENERRTSNGLDQREDDMLAMSRKTVDVRSRCATIARSFSI